MYDSVSSPYGREGIYPVTAASRPDEVWPSGGRTGPEDFPLLQNTSCLLFSCNVTAHSLLPCHTLTCTICYFCVAPLAHRLRSWLSEALQPWTDSTEANNDLTVQHVQVFRLSGGLRWGGSPRKNDNDQRYNHIWQGDRMSRRCPDDLMTWWVLFFFFCWENQWADWELDNRNKKRNRESDRKSFFMEVQHLIDKKRSLGRKDTWLSLISQTKHLMNC